MRKEKNATKVAQIEKRIDKAKEDMLQKDRLKNVSLGTSKINYPSPNPIPNPNPNPDPNPSPNPNPNQVSLGTSKINYNDPRITVAWCKRHDVPIHKPFPKTLLAKFSWAMAVEPEFKF